MHIKQVIIQGFRSYKDQTIVEPFSPRHNVVVGRNGSGKSNFFLAIQFVLSDEFSHIGEEERQQLLHEGTGSRAVSAYVEIIFDNLDNRLPIDKEEVSLKRVIGSKKDQYFLDKKNVTKLDVMNLLESAGFSRSNPYYIVKQGRIAQLAVAKDKERLRLLREVAGARVFDAKKTESEDILKDTEGYRAKISETMKELHRKLESLKEDAEELKQYKKLDKERRCLEYAIYDRELKETKQKLEELDKNHQNNSDKTRELHDLKRQASEKIEENNREIKKLNDRKNVREIEKQQVLDERAELVKEKTKLELDVSDLEKNVTDDAHANKRNTRELKKLEETIRQKKDELKEILPEYMNQKSTEEECQKQKQSKEQRRENLYAKQGRGSEFKNKEQRDQWIKNELNSLSKLMKAKEHKAGIYREEIGVAKERLEKIEQENKERTDNLEERKTQMDDANAHFRILKNRRDEHSNKRKELWREEIGLEQSVQSTRDELSRAERSFRSRMSPAVANGIESVQSIIKENNIDGVYGPLIENFTCEEKYFVAVEVTAGNKLFNIIVDDDKIGSRVLKLMNRQNLPGEVTFMPLKKLKFRDLQYPNSPDVIPMLNKINYNPLFKPAMQLAFGKTLICRNMEVASTFSKSANLDCITMEGDQQSRRGAITGGFYDFQNSRLELQKKMWQSRAKLEEQEEQLRKLKEKISVEEAQVTSVVNELQKIETKQDQLRATYERQQEDVRHLSKEKQGLEATVSGKRDVLLHLDNDLTSYRNSIKLLNEEVGTELQSQLSTTDQRELEKLNEEILQHQEQLKQACSRRAELECQKETLENLLSTNLMRRKEELEMNIAEVRTADRQWQLEAKNEELSRCDANLDKCSSRSQALDSELEMVKNLLAKLHSSLEEAKTREREHCEALEEDSKTMEDAANARSLLKKKKDESEKHIMELGSLPAEAFGMYRKTDIKKLWKKLHKCQAELKKFSHVNKRSLDQHEQLTTDTEKLTQKTIALDESKEAIVNMKDVLDQRKHEKVIFYFKQISHHFSAIFKQLVPSGKATLIMKSEAADSQDEEISVASSQKSSFPPIDEFVGISIKVSFTGDTAETYEMNQLSGGQKTLVALTLIFAIQKCDPAPFYLFDEIDQALDPQYRSAVANMINELADKAQFITTSFRPELLENADKFYGVQFKHRVSHILSITKEQAKNFVEDDTVEEDTAES